MSRSLIQTANISPAPLAAGAQIPLGNVVRRFGCNCRLSGNAIELEGAGYYTINAAITVTPDAIGNITVAAYLDNVPIPAAVAVGSVDTISDSVTLPITATVRMGCCCEGASQLTFTIDNAADLVSASVRVEKA